MLGFFFSFFQFEVIVMEIALLIDRNTNPIKQKRNLNDKSHYGRN